jgi:hypothetical protein
MRNSPYGITVPFQTDATINKFRVLMNVSRGSLSRRVAILSGLAVLVAIANSPAQERGESRPSPRLERPIIPEPPRQKDPWQPPATTLPAFLANASATLFEQGVADTTRLGTVETDTEGRVVEIEQLPESQLCCGTRGAMMKGNLEFLMT